MPRRRRPPRRIPRHPIPGRRPWWAVGAYLGLTGERARQIAIEAICRVQDALGGPAEGVTWEDALGAVVRALRDSRRRG